MARRSTFLLLLLLILTGATLCSARNNPRATRRTFLQPRVDPRRRAVPRQRLTEFQPGRSFVPRPLAAPSAQRRAFWHVSGRGAQIDRGGEFAPFGSFRFHNNRILHERRSSFRRRR
jgi:hypothetical protein